MFVSCYKPPDSQILHSLSESVSSSFHSVVLVGELNCKHTAWNCTSVDTNSRKLLYFSLSQYTAVNHPENPKYFLTNFQTIVFDISLSTWYSVQNTLPDTFQIQDIFVPWVCAVRLLSLVIGFSSPCICTPLPIKPRVYSVTYSPLLKLDSALTNSNNLTFFKYLFFWIFLTPPMCGAPYAIPTSSVSKLPCQNISSHHKIQQKSECCVTQLYYTRLYIRWKFVQVCYEERPEWLYSCHPWSSFTRLRSVVRKQGTCKGCK